MSEVMRVHHVALWVRNLERMRTFYVDVLGGQNGPLYENPRTGLRSYFISFSEGARVELMTQTSQSTTPDVVSRQGYAHIALSVGGRVAVDETIVRLKDRGVTVLNPPRTTGDGYYEAVVEDPEGNRIEIVE